jgi:hypothetical protein
MTFFNKPMGDGDFEFTFMHRGELHQMRGRVKDATLHAIPKNGDRPYVCSRCEYPDVDSLLDSGYDCFRPMRVFFEFEEQDNGKFSAVRKVQDEDI